MTMLKDVNNSVGSNGGGSGRTSTGKIDAHKVFVEMTMSRFLETYGTVKEYYDSFTSRWSSILTCDFITGIWCLCGGRR
ncbi:hypothetical protein CTI12_AA323940 [Artemisia annua]|uniref:Uncharacterized protein n=1 Tax=Artemisia annua TaxID=35608 RepID=A0A2U1N098_ARTAN|nr:hypothetical protein CTI12_AA323940 [Artemisia annua]